MIPVKLTVENPDEQLAGLGAGAIVRVQYSADNVTFANLTTAAIVAGTTIYTVYDTAHATNGYYRSRYESSDGSLVSDWSAGVQATAFLATYASLYDAKQRLGIAATDTADDENLLGFGIEASGWIDSVTGRRFLPDPPTGTTTYLFDGVDAQEYGRLLLVPRGIRSITTLQLATNTGATLQTIPATDYFLRPAAQEREPGWPATELWMTDVPSSTNPLPLFLRGLANISITGAFAWAATPAEIEDIALTGVVSLFRSRGATGGETVTIGTSGERVIERSLTYEQRATLARYTVKNVVVI